jgi:two-component system, OmpR family, sensor kinase
MSVTGESSGGFWRSVRQLPDRSPLRVKLITAVLALVAVGLVIISVAGIGYLSSYLLNQQDAQLSGSENNAATLVQDYLNVGHTTSLYETTVLWLPNRSKSAQTVVYPGTRAFGSGSQANPGIRTSAEPGPEIQAGASWLAGNEAVTVPASSGGHRWRVIAFPDQAYQSPNGSQVTGTIIVGEDVSNIYRTIGKLTGIDIIVSGILLLGLAVVGIAVVRASLRPLTDIEQTAEAIAAGDLSRRVPDRDPRTEIGRLGRSLNTMLAQIETAFHARAQSEAAARRSEDRMRQFVADASHELRTPLTAIRGFAEYYRQRGGVAPADPAGHGELAGPAERRQLPAGQDSASPSAALPAGALGGNGSGQLAPADLDRIMRRVEQESSRMGILVEDMLLLARLDQQRPLEHRTVDLLTLAADAVHDARVVAPDRSINLTVGAGAALLVLGDEVRLRQVIGNLMSNALSHTPDGTPIDVRIRSGSLTEAWTATAPPPPPAAASLPPPPSDPSAPAVPSAPSAPPAPGPGARTSPRSAAVLEVTDHGPGLTREQAEHAFERFYRADQARTTGGTGLGLAIVAALVAAHGGAVWVESVPGQGATFRIALPLAPEALHDDHDDHDDAADADTAGHAWESGLPADADDDAPGARAAQARWA